MYETFKKLKFNQIVLITSSDCMNSTPTERAYKVGRRTHSKRYNLEKLTLIPYRFKDVKKPDPRCKHYLYFRKSTESLTFAHVDLACSLHGIREPEISSPYAVKTVSKAIS